MMAHTRDRSGERHLDVVERNIQALVARRKADDHALRPDEKAAEVISRFAGSTVFVVVHAAAYGGWIVINSGLVPGLPVFDPSFVMLAMIASVESIFLSTFILITQSRMSEAADRRAELNLQISLLAEHEVTRLLALTAAIGRKLEVPQAVDPYLGELERDVAPEHLLDRIERKDQDDNGGDR